MLINKRDFIFVITICTLIFFSWYYKGKSDGYNQEYQNAVARLDTIKQEVDGIYSRLIESTTKSIGKLQNDTTEKSLKIKTLQAIVSKQKEQILSLVAFQASWKPDTVYHKARVDSFVNNAKQFEVRFSENINGVHIKGFTITPPPQAFLNVNRLLVNFSVSMVQNRNGQYKTYITTDDNGIKINSIEGKIVPYKQNGFWDKVQFNPAVSIGYRKYEGLFLMVRLNIWRFTPIGVINTNRLDYGGMVDIWKR